MQFFLMYTDVLMTQYSLNTMFSFVQSSCDHLHILVSFVICLLFVCYLFVICLLFGCYLFVICLLFVCYLFRFLNLQEKHYNLHHTHFVANTGHNRDSETYCMHTPTYVKSSQASDDEGDLITITLVWDFNRV